MQSQTRRCVDNIDCGPPLPDWICSRTEKIPTIQCFTEESANFRRVFVPLSRRGAKTNDNRIRLKYILQRIFTHANFSGVGRSSKCGPPSAGRLLRLAKNVLNMDLKHFSQPDKISCETIMSLSSHTNTAQAVAVLLDLFVWTDKGLVSREQTGGSRYTHWINRTHMRTLSTRSAKNKSVRDSIMNEVGWEKCEVLSKLAVDSGVMYNVRMECGKAMRIIQEPGVRPVIERRPVSSSRVLVPSKRWVLLMSEFLPEVASTALRWNRQIITKFHTLKTGRSGDRPGSRSRFEVAASVHGHLRVAGAGIRDTKTALDMLFDRPGRVTDVAHHYQEHVPSSVWTDTLHGFRQDVQQLRNRLIEFGHEVTALGLTPREVGGLAGSFVRSSLKGSAAEEEVANPTTMADHIASNTHVYRFGECFDGMVTDGSISADSLAYAFESHAGPSGDSPGILRQRLMWRYEGVLGGGDVARDATTKAKLDGGISDYTWDKHVVHGFNQLQDIITWRRPLTEPSEVAERRRSLMVPYMKYVLWHVHKQKKQYPTGRSILIVELKPMMIEFIMRFLPMGQFLDYLCTHNVTGMAISMRPQACVYVSFLIDATVMGKSNTGDRKGVLHHTRGAIKVIVAGKECRSVLSHTVVMLATGNDHGQEVLEDVAEGPEGDVEGNQCPSIWDQLIHILDQRFLTMTGDGMRLSKREVKLLIKFHQWITDGAGARENHWRTSACSPRDCAHFTPQLKRVRQLIVQLLGMYFVRFGSFPGFKGEVVDKLVADVEAGTHPVVGSTKQLKGRTGITGHNPFHSKLTPMDAVRINPGVWHNGSTWALFFLMCICVMMRRAGCLKAWHRHMTECVKVCGKWKYWLTTNGVEIYGKDADMLRQWILLVSGFDTFSCDDPICMQACRDKISVEDGRVHFVGRAQTTELDFVMQVNRVRLQMFDQTNAEVFWSQAPFLPLVGLVHDNQIADIFGARALNTKTAEATYLFVAMVDQVLERWMTLASTYEKPIEREHDRGKNEVSRTSVSRGGTGDPNSTRARGIKRVAIGAEISKMRRVAGAKSTYEHLRRAKEEPNYDRPHPVPAECDPNPPCEGSGNSSPSVDNDHVLHVEDLTEDQQSQLAAASTEEREQILELHARESKRYSPTWASSPCIKRFTIGTDISPPHTAKLCPNSAMGWDVPTTAIWGGVTTIRAKLLYGGKGLIVVIVKQGSLLPTFKYQIEYDSLSALGWCPERQSITFEFVTPIRLFRLNAATNNWERCEYSECASSGNSCHAEIIFSRRTEATRVEQGLRAMGPPGQTEVLFNTAIDSAVTMNSASVMHLRSVCAALNKDATGAFLSPNFEGSDLHLRLVHRRKLFLKTETMHRIVNGPSWPKRGTTKAFPICCSACRPICNFCGKPHFLVLYPDDSGKCRFVTADGVDHTCCPTLEKDPLKTPSFQEVMRMQRCYESSLALFGDALPPDPAPVDVVPDPAPVDVVSDPAPVDVVSDPAPVDVVSDPTPDPASILPSDFVCGARVSARFHNIRGKWYDGVIEKINDDGTIDILYDDSDREHNIPYHCDRVRLIVVDPVRRRSRRNRIRKRAGDFEY